MRFLSFIKNKFTIGAVFSLLASVLVGLFIRSTYQYVCGVSLLLEGDITLNALYLSTLALFRFIFAAGLEFKLGTTYHMPILDYKGSTVLYMDDNSTSNDSSSKPSSSNTGLSGSGSGSSNQGGSSVITKEVVQNIKANLVKDMKDNVTTQWNMVDKLIKMKKDHNIKLYSVDGNLEIGVPPSMTDEEVAKITKQVGIIDRIIQTKFSEYKNMKKADANINGSKLDITSDIMSKANKVSYKMIFDDDDDNS